jgi:hypothetical protein
LVCVQAAKIDQYTLVDKKWDKNSDLHSELFKRNRHPNNIRYCLVARVVLGRHVRTRDGITQLDSDQRPLFTDHRRAELAPFPDGSIPSSLLGETGGCVREFREFVVFHPDQIFVEYLIGYRRVRRLCDCGVPVAERSVTTESPNRGRRIHLCGGLNDGNERVCQYIQMFPLCDCARSAFVATSASEANPGKRFYCCNYRQFRGRRGFRNECEFFQWK